MHAFSQALFAATLLLTAFSQAQEIRVFRSTEGKTLTASFVSLTGDTVTLKRQDGKIFELPTAKLSTEDQTYIASFALQAGELGKKINTAAGREIAGTLPFANRKAEEIATKFGLRPESRSKYGRSWRLYAATLKDYLLFGAMPYSVALYSSQEGLATSMSIVFANKGDFGSTAGLARDHFKGGTTATESTLAGAMERDEQTVAASLTAVLGAGKTERYGEGKTRRKVTRWDWNGYAFLLSHEDGEYVGLAIVSSDTANTGGKTTISKDADLKKRLLTSVVKSPNGDVHITEIPMVDQGPKGYCVPATFERGMRTMGLEADMYLLAMVGQSGVGGGTVIELLLENVRHQVLSKGRRIKEEEIKQLRIQDFKRYIDQGVPVMWTLCSMPEYNDIADKNTAVRAKITDWKTHAAEILTSHEKLAKSPKPDSNRHLCMIIGYNEATQEIAVSDSWGPQFELRWVPLPVAAWASSDSLFMILP